MTLAESYDPSQNIFIDESMVCFKDRSTMKQYLPMKSIKRGFKIWCSSCSCCGYLLKFIYTPAWRPERSRTRYRVVTHLVIPRFRSNMDNFFTSIAIFRKLSENCILACGTYRTSRIGLPADLADRMSWSHWDAASIVQYKGNTTAIVWIDQKSLYVIPNAHLPTTTMVKGGNSHVSKSEVSCSTPVSESNRHMGGVDLLDQHKCYYSYNGKSKHWWLHHFIHMFDLSIVNAYIYILYNMRIEYTFIHHWNPSWRITWSSEWRWTTSW